MNKIVVAVDSFKGSVSSQEAGDAVARAAREVFPGCVAEVIPVSDGGEGMIDAFLNAAGGVVRSVWVSDPLRRRVEARYAVSEEGNRAVIELAQAAGLPLLSPDERNPELTTTYGVGELIVDAMTGGCRDFLIGIGGSATNDGGTGMLEALGIVFRNERGERVSGQGGNLCKISTIDTSGVHPLLKECRFRVACDVTNPFCGPTGATAVFSSQKGADAAMRERLERGMAHLHALIEQQYGVSLNRMAGSGAAGGVGGALAHFLNAALEPGAEVLLRALRFDERLQGADLLVTGEGRMDAQTLMGKMPYRVMRRAAAAGIPVLALCGAAQDTELLNAEGFTSVLSIHPAPLPLAEAMERETTLRHLNTVARQLFRLWAAVAE